MILNTCFNETESNVGLALSAYNTTQKCYMSGTDLLVIHAFMDFSFVDNEIYKAILFDKLRYDNGKCCCTNVT